MKSLKKINIDFYITSLILASFFIFVLLVVTLGLSFYYFDALHQSKESFDKFIESSPLKKIQEDKAQAIINYKPEVPLIDSKQIRNPFQSIEEPEE